MRICNICVDGRKHLAVVTDRGIVDAVAAGLTLTIDEVIAGAGTAELSKIAADETLPSMQEDEVEFACVVNKPDKIVCVGLNYGEHAENCGERTLDTPTLFSKFSDALSAADAEIRLPPWESSFDYEAELVVVIGKKTGNVSIEQARECIFGYTCGNDLSCRDAQMRTSQWLIGKALPKFGPCGPYIVTADEYNPSEAKYIRCYVNGEMKQDGLTSQMIFKCEEIVSYASKYIDLNPGDLIFTGTPGGVIVEKKSEERVWLKSGDLVEVEIEGLGRLRNRLI